MTSQTTLGPRYAALLVTAFAIGHLLAVARPQAHTGHGVSPDVAAVAADAVLLVRPQLVRLPLRAVTALAGQFTELYVFNVREVHVIGLPRVNQPWHFAVRSHIRCDEILLGGRGAHGLRVAPGALLERRDAGERAVVAEGVAILAFHPGLVLMHHVTEVHGLLCLLIED